MDKRSLIEVNAPQRSAWNWYVIGALGLNCIFWVSFWVLFAIHAVPFDRDAMGLGADVIADTVTVFGNAIGVDRGLARYWFVLVETIIQLPSLALVAVVREFFLVLFDLFGPAGRTSLIGTDTGGYTVIATMLVSFAQWYYIGRFVQVLAARWAQRGRKQFSGGT